MKNSFPIVVAIIIAVVSLLAVKSYVGKVNQADEERRSGKVLVAAASDLEAGAELSLQNMVPREVPDEFIPTQAIVGKAQAQMAEGKKLKFNVAVGQIILWSDLELPSRGFASTIPPGERAYTVQFGSGVNTAFINPNDRIDILASFQLPEDPDVDPQTLPGWRLSSDRINVMLLQNVTVLAVGDSFAGGGPGFGKGSGGQLTLSLTLQEAQLVMFAEQQGELGAVLRRDGNIAAIEQDQLGRVSFKDLEDRIGVLDEERENRRIIKIRQGAVEESVPVKGN